MLLLLALGVILLILLVALLVTEVHLHLLREVPLLRQVVKMLYMEEPEASLPELIAVEALEDTHIIQPAVVEVVAAARRDTPEMEVILVFALARMEMAVVQVVAHRVQIIVFVVVVVIEAEDLAAVV
jgi:hypothetical protein